jgi:hypothetical protein
MLAYVFWHWPTREVDRARYLDAQRAFHRALAAAPSPGLRGSRVRAVSGAPWVPGPEAFEDWYLVDDFAALGALNDAAVAGARRAPHDGVARLADGGAGGLYRQLTAGGPGAVTRVTWLSKPAGMAYPDFLARMPAGVELWQRQLVLGPAPEFCLHREAPPPGLEGLTLAVRDVVA